MTAQIVTLPEETNREGITKVKFSFTSTDAGVVVAAMSNIYVTGILFHFDMYPDQATTTPTASFTFTVKDRDGVDLLNGLGIGSSTATAQVSKSSNDGLATMAFNTKLQLDAAGMGNAKHAILDLYFG